MKEMAYAALAIAFIGLVMMFAGVIYESNYRSFDCTDSDWVRETYGDDDPEDIEACYTEQASTYDSAQVLHSGGYPIILFAIVLMIGANKLQDS
jgi:hypothetical protein